MTGATHPTHTVWVGNLDSAVTEETLRQLFASAGPIKSIKCARDRCKTDVEHPHLLKP